MHDAEPFRRKRVSGCRKIEAPDANADISHHGEGLGLARLQAPSPVTERERVMLPKTLHVTTLESRCFGSAEEVRERHHLPIWEDVTLDEAALAPQPLAQPGGEAPEPRALEVDDPVVQEKTPRPQHSVDRGKIGGQAAAADVLDHPDAGHLVEDWKRGEVAIVSDLDPTTGT